MTRFFSIIFIVVLCMSATLLLAEDPNALPEAVDALQTSEIQPAPDTIVKEETGYDKYKVIYQKNMFSRRRQPTRRYVENASEPIKKQVVLSLYVLRGVAIQGNSRVVFIEEVVSGRSMKAHAGTELLGGTITEVKINSVVFRQNDQLREIPVGGEFGKTETETQIEDQTLQEPEEISQPQPSQPQQQASPVNEDELLKQMMQRRNRELGR